MLKPYWLTRLCADLSRKSVRRRSAASGRTNQTGLESLEVRLLLSGDHVASMAGGHAASMTVDDDGAMTGGHGNGHTCTAHSDDAVKATEHCASMQLATPAGASHVLVATGNWSDEAVWENGVLPTDEADVYIPAHLTVTVDGVIDAVLHSVRIDGTLRFRTSVNTQLSVDTIIGASGSRLEMGTAEQPVAADVTARILIADTGPIDRSWDPYALSRGAILHGTTVIHGAARTSWESLAKAPEAGDTTLTLTMVPDGWRVADVLVIAGVSDEGTGDETVRIAALDGHTVTLDHALTRDHLPPSSEFQIHVANTTRNAVFESQNTALDRRGHVMFMHSRDVSIAYGGFYELGRTNKLRAPDDAVLNSDGSLVAGTGTNVRGRYSVHFHRNGVQASAAPAVVHGTAVVGNPGWGYVNHSSYVDMTDNVAFNVAGSAFATEAGDEIGMFVRNLAIRTHGTEGDTDVEREPLEDWGHEGNGFWLQGPGVTVEHNVAAGATGSGLYVYANGLTQAGSGKTMFLAENLNDPALAKGVHNLPVALVPLKSFRHNTVYGSVEGAAFAYLDSLLKVEDEGLAALREHGWEFEPSVVEDLTVWNVYLGVTELYTGGAPGSQLTFRNITMVNHLDSSAEIGHNAELLYNRGRHHYENLRIEGFAMGMQTARAGLITVDGGYFNNGQDFHIAEPRSSHRRLEFTGDIEFGGLQTFDFDGELIDRTHYHMKAEIVRKEDSAEQWFGLTDHVLVNTGNGDSRQLFFPEQEGEHVLFPQQLPPTTESDPEDADPRIPRQYIGLTNAELRAQHGFSLGGTLPSDDAVDQPDDRINGLVGSPVPDPFPLPEVDDPLDDDEVDDDEVDDDDEDDDDEVDFARLAERIQMLRAESDSEYAELLNQHDWDPGERIALEPLLDRLRAIDEGGIQTELDELDSETLSNLEGLLDAFEFNDENETGNETDVVIEVPESSTGTVQVLLDDGHVVVMRGNDELQRRSLTSASTLTIEGTAGDDNLEFHLTDASELQLQSIAVNGRAGDDDIRLTGLADELARILRLSGNAGDDRITVTETVEAGVLMNGNAGHDSLRGGRGGDTLHGGPGNDVLTGGDGDDRLNGHGGHDTLSGDAGHDHLNSHGGHDVLSGGAGNDRMRGGAGHDVLAGGNGRDRLNGQRGRDTLHGGADDDWLLGAAGNDLLTGGDGHDTLAGHGGRDTLSGGAGNDRLTGHGGHDVLSGNDGNDWLRGRSGNDVLAGGNGDDRLDGQQGRDSLHGGSGKDQLKGGAGQDILFGGDGNDWISGQAGRDTVVTGAGEDRVTGPVSEIDEDFAWIAGWIDLV
jgi:Ca2+-binding RTX toxin-like protein